MLKERCYLYIFMQAQHSKLIFYVINFSYLFLLRYIFTYEVQDGQSLYAIFVVILIFIL